MKNMFKTTVMSRVQQGVCTNRINSYLDKGYTVESTEKLASLKDGSDVVRYTLIYDEVLIPSSTTQLLPPHKIEVIKPGTTPEPLRLQDKGLNNVSGLSFYYKKSCKDRGL